MKLAYNKLTQALSWGIIFLITLNKFHIASIIDTEIIAVVSLCLIIGQINIDNRLINLENKPMNFLGKISYGIYVIHPLMILFVSKLIRDWQINGSLKLIVAYLMVLLATILCAYLSYHYYEKYFLKLKDKFVVVPSVSSPSK